MVIAPQPVLRLGISGLGRAGIPFGGHSEVLHHAGPVVVALAQGDLRGGPARVGLRLQFRQRQLCEVLRGQRLRQSQYQRQQSGAQAADHSLPRTVCCVRGVRARMAACRSRARAWASAICSGVISAAITSRVSAASAWPAAPARLSQAWAAT